MNRLLLIAAVGLAMAAACKKPETAAPDAPPPKEAPTSDTSTAAAPAGNDQSDSARIDQINQSIDSILGDHTEYKAVIDAFQRAVKAKDAAAVAALVHYPISVIVDGGRTAIKDEQSFITNYDRFMTPAMAAAITNTAYADVMVNAQGVMLGSGEAWVNGVCADTPCKQFAVKIVAIQPGPKTQ